jgi:hypothetical protein
MIMTFEGNRRGRRMVGYVSVVTARRAVAWPLFHRFVAKNA